MSKSLVEIKRAKIEKEKVIAVATAENDAKIKERTLRGELQYSQDDLDVLEQAHKSQVEGYQFYWMPVAQVWWVCAGVAALTAIITAIILHYV